MTAVLTCMRRINNGIALIAGLALAGCVVFMLLDVVLRRLGSTLGGADEIGGYVMAGVTAWGMAFALVEMAHVRIDIVRTRLGQSGRVLLDLIALVAMAATVCVVAMRSWPVLERSIALGARANTPLETPLWIPQLIWFAGWAWFAIAICLLVLCTVPLLLGHRLDEAEHAIGARSEAEGLT